MASAVAEIVLFHLTVNSPRKEVGNRADAGVVTHRNVFTLKKLPGKQKRTLATCCVRKSTELTKGEVAGMDGYDVEEVSLRLGVAEAFDSLDLFSRHFHRDKISAAGSGCTLLGQRQDTRGALAPCSGLYLRVRRVVPRPSATPGGSPR